MKRSGWLAGALSFALVATAIGVSQAAQAPVAGEVTYLAGVAEKSSGSTWEALKQGSKLSEGDRVRTKEKARLEAKLKDGSLLRLAESSELRLDQAKIKKGGEKKVKAKLFFGRVWAAVTELIGKESTFEVSTENAVAGVRGTRFEASRDASGATTVKVFGGKVLVSNKPVYQVEGATKAKRVQVAGPQEISKDQWTELVAGAMQMVQVAASGEVSPAQSFAAADPAADDWEKWNAERDTLAGLEK